MHLVSRMGGEESPSTAGTKGRTKTPRWRLIAAHAERDARAPFRVLIRDMLVRLEDRNREALLRERVDSGDLLGVDQGLEFFIRGPEVDMIVRGRA